MSYEGIWRAWRDSNPRPKGPQPFALSPELQARSSDRSQYITQAPHGQSGLPGGQRSGIRQRPAQEEGDRGFRQIPLAAG